MVAKSTKHNWQVKAFSVYANASGAYVSTACTELEMYVHISEMHDDLAYNGWWMHWIEHT